MAATLCDLFLADLNELSEEEVDVLMEGEEEDIAKEVGVELENLSCVLKSQRYSNLLQIIEDDYCSIEDYNNEYELIQETNTLLMEIEEEFILINNFIRDKYRAKFPELESLIDQPIVYVHAVKKIGNETELNLVGLENLLPSSTIMSVLSTGSTTNGKPLPQEVLHKTLEACDRAIQLDVARNKMLDFLDSRMAYIAPNLSALVGTSVAAKLVGTAGGLDALAKIPACNIMLLGSKKSTNLAGFSFSTQSRVGFIRETQLFQSTPPPHRMFTSHLVASKSALAVRVDSERGDPSGSIGRRFREEICSKIDKRQEPPPARILKPLPVPRDNAKKKRGGRRLRKAKQKYEQTNASKLANRVPFGVPENSSLGDGYGVGYGMIGQAGSGLLRVSHAKPAKKHLFSREIGSCFALTPVQGIELPTRGHQCHSGITQSTYFSEIGTFSKIRRLI